jgi:hypothetical protein
MTHGREPQHRAVVSFASAVNSCWISLTAQRCVSDAADRDAAAVRALVRSPACYPPCHRSCAEGRCVSDVRAGTTRSRRWTVSMWTGPWSCRVTWLTSNAPTSIA